MITAIALFLILIFLFLSALHIYWAFGGQWGNSAVLPTRDDNIKVMINYIGFFKKIKNTRFGRNDTKYYSPLCLLIGLLAIVLEINK